MRRKVLLPLLLTPVLLLTGCGSDELATDLEVVEVGSDGAAGIEPAQGHELPGEVGHDEGPGTHVPPGEIGHPEGPGTE